MTAAPYVPGHARPGYAASWAEMTAAVVAHLDAYGPDAVRDVDSVLIGYTLTARDVICGECEPEPESGPRPEPRRRDRRRRPYDTPLDALDGWMP